MRGDPERLTTLPNLLSLLRIALAPLMLISALDGERWIFLALLSASWISDWLDGLIARRLNMVSTLGARLDSLGDFVVYVTLPVGLYLLWPEVIQQELIYIVVGFSAYIAAHLFALIKFRQLAGYHMWSAKFTAVVMAVALLLMLGWDLRVPFHLAVLCLLLSCLESMLISVKLKRFRPDIPSFFLLRKDEGEGD